MKVLRDIFLITLRYLKITAKNPVFLSMGIVFPVTYLSLFAPLLNNLAAKGSFFEGNVLNLFVMGMLPIIAFSTGIFTGFGIIDELRSGIIERFRVTPASRFAILAGPVFHDVCATLFQCAFFILIALPFGFRTSIVGIFILLLQLILLTLITSSFGNALGVLMKSEDRYAPIIHAINLPIFLLSGVLLPMSLAPTWLKTLAHFNPVYYVVEASRSLATGDIFNFSVLCSFSILIPIACLAMFWATSVFRKATA